MTETTSSSTCQCCQFWISSKNSCNVSPGGLFIPLSQHTEIYCKTLEHTNCPQFKLEDNETTESKQQEINSANRRTHKRISGNKHINFVSLNDSGKPETLYNQEANAIDISFGGMRLRTRTPLMTDTLLQFFFNNTGSSNQTSGLAKIMWCVPRQNSAGYQAGVAFFDRKTSDNINNHIIPAYH